MKAQCDFHGCSELLCGCSINVLKQKQLLNNKKRLKLNSIKNRAVRFESINKEDLPLVIWFIEKHLKES